MSNTKEYETTRGKILLHCGLEWKPATSIYLSDYPLGTLCKDKKGNTFLIGDAIAGENIGVGCGCCSDSITDNEITEVATILEFTPYHKLGDSTS